MRKLVVRSASVKGVQGMQWTDESYLSVGVCGGSVRADPQQLHFSTNLPSGPLWRK